MKGKKGSAEVRKEEEGRKGSEGVRKEGVRIQPCPRTRNEA